jgi:cell division protein FtsI/penicillin-binding protein 2
MGLLLIVLCLAILLHRSMLIGRRAAQPFAFYLVSGIAIITGIQFLVITLGSIGLIPLTGVAVPFLSHGMTSMIINLAAFGIVFSISQKEGAPEQKEYISGYDYLVGVGSFSYIAASILLLSVLAWFQFFARDHYLIKPAYVTTQQGERIVEYNPRINQLMSRLYAGNIYDRTGRIILATNDKNAIKASDYVQAGVDNHFLENELKQRKQRYYPFGDNLFFMVGDYNSKILWTFDENNPVGYIAESQHLAALRGFNNLKPDENDKTKIKRILLTSEKYKGSTFLHKMEKEYKYTDYDYSYLLPGLKQGLNGDFVKKHNEASKNREITLTVDAELQTKMQNEMLGDVAGNFHNSKFDKMRISVVVLDAKQGDLLCSANYPLPNQDTLKNMPKVYNDQKKNFKAYTDRDLGMTYQTPPGSTAKVMSALAGLQKLGTAAANKTYFIDPREIVEVGIEPTGNAVTMEQAIRISSNNYFINLVNDNDLYASLDSIYQTVGIRLDKPATKIDKGKPVNYHKPLVPYYLAYERDMEKSEEYKVEMIAAGQKAVSKYKNYVEKRDKNRNNPAVYEKMNDGKKGWLPQHAWAWGQGTLSATPLNMARVASIVANNGNFVPTKYLLNDDSNEHLKIPAQQEIPIVSSSNANEKLREYMINEANWNVTNDRQITSVNPKNANMGGKTGTPERELYFKTYSQKRGKEVVSEVKKMNDGWYIFFIDSKKTKSPLAVAVRMERLPLGTGSGTAVRFADRVVIKTLRDLGYIE